MSHPWDEPLELAPLREEERELAPDEDFRPEMILVPVRCGVCKLLHYASREHVGKWLTCPDCQRLNQIRDVPLPEQVKVEISPNGGLSLAPLSSIPKPEVRSNVDYRTIKGAIDEGTERLPNLVREEIADDKLEEVFDILLARKKGKKRAEPLAVAPPKIIQVPVPAPPVVESIAKTPETMETTGIQRVAPTVISPWTLQQFLSPFTDKRNRGRFRFDRYVGIFSVFMSLNLGRLFGQFLFSADPRSPDHIYGFVDMTLFYLEYLATFLPLAVWTILVVINSMSLFDQTRHEGGRIKEWIRFRTELAFQYLFWLGIVMMIAPFPGAILSTILFWCGYDNPIRILLVPASIILFYPIIFLCFGMSDHPFDLFNRTVWSSLFRLSGRWLVCYLATLPPVGIMVSVLITASYLIIWSIPAGFWIAQPLFLIAGVLLSQAFVWSCYLLSRLWGSLAWSIENS